MERIIKYTLLGFVLIAFAGVIYMISTREPHRLIQEHIEEKKAFESKIEKHEREIFEDSVIIHNSNRSYRDSIRTAIYRQYMHRDSLH
jgi:hypothetical protein